MKNKDLYKTLLHLRRHAQEALENFTMMEMGVGERQTLATSLLEVRKHAAVAEEEMVEPLETTDSCDYTDNCACSSCKSTDKGTDG
jgi:hypothetical protein